MSEPTEPSRGRFGVSPKVLWTVIGAIAVVGLVVVFALGGEDDDSGDTTAAISDGRTDEQGDVGGSDDLAAEPGTAEDPVAPGDSAPAAGEEASELPIPRDPIQPGEETLVCAAVVERLGQYRQIAIDNGGPTREMFESLSDFESEIFTLADGGTWGDRIIERVVVVRREWSTGLAAAEQGEAGEAERRAAAAVAELDAAIAVADCPTP